MTPEDLATIESSWLQTCGPCDGGLAMGCTCPDADPRPVIFLLVEEVKRLSAARTQDAARYVASTPDSIAVPHSSSAVLGYSVASPTTRDLHPWVLTDRYLNTIDLDPAVPLPEEVDLADGECIVAVVRIGPDGRIGS